MSMFKYVVVDGNNSIYGRYSTIPECYQRISELSNLKRFHVLTEEKLPSGYLYTNLDGSKHNFIEEVLTYAY